MRAVTWHGRRDVRAARTCTSCGRAPAAAARTRSSTDLATDRLPLEQAPDAYAAFQQKKEGTIKVVFQPSSR